MKKKAIGSLIAVLALSVLSFAKDNAATMAAPRVFSINGDALRELRVKIMSGKLKAPALETLRTEADAALKIEPPSVMQKSQLPPSGNKHDYISLAPYWWPDPSKPNGLPYIRRDGERNPEILEMRDSQNCDKMMSATRTLALAYYLTGDERYAAKAATLLRVWFLDPATRMNPNMEFAQAVRGINDGRGIGLIETHGYSFTVDAVGMLAGSRAWSAADQKGMEDWFSKYLTWMRESKNGRDESAEKNNHGTYYDVQIASIALFLGNKELAAETLKRETLRISAQLDQDGGQPLELARTKALGYSTFNLSALMQLACLGDNVGIDLWSFRSEDGKSIRKALDFLTPYITGQKKWPYKQIAPYSARQSAPLYLLAARKFHNPGYKQIAQKINPERDSDVNCLLATLH